MNIEDLKADFLYQANRANLLLLSSQPPKLVDAIFFHDRSYGDFTNLLEMAGVMYKTGAARFIATTNTDAARFGGNIPGEASAGKDWTVKHLLEQQVPIESILHPDTPSHHTREENNSFLELSEDELEKRSNLSSTSPTTESYVRYGACYG